MKRPELAIPWDRDDVIAIPGNASSGSLIPGLGPFFGSLVGGGVGGGSRGRGGDRGGAQPASTCRSGIAGAAAAAVETVPMPTVVGG